MATFKSERFFKTDLKELGAVANRVQDHFEANGYAVLLEENALGYFISISKGGIFKAVLGMKTALNVEIRSLEGGISASAHVGIFGQQLLPSMISLFIAWPVLVTQITGLVKQSKLDDEALDVIEQSIRTMEAGAGSGDDGNGFCTACGSRIQSGAKFCSECGAKVGQECDKGAAGI